MKSIIFLCLAVLLLAIGATGISIAFMALNSSWGTTDFISTFITSHADWPTAKVLFFSYLFLFSGIILAAKHLTSRSTKSE